MFTKPNVTQKRFGNIMRGDQRWVVFKIGKRMVKTKQVIISEQCTGVMIVHWQSVMKRRK